MEDGNNNGKKPDNNDADWDETFLTQKGDEGKYTRKPPHKKSWNTQRVIPWPTTRYNWPYHLRCFICGERDILIANLERTRYYCPVCQRAKELELDDTIPYKIANSDQDPTVPYKLHAKTKEDQPFPFPLKKSFELWNQYRDWSQERWEDWVEWLTKKWYRF